MGRQVAALAGPACGSCYVWFLLQTSAPRLWCSGGARVWREHGWTIPAACNCEPWAGRLAWTLWMVASSWSRAGMSLTGSGWPRAHGSSGEGVLQCAKHKWNKPSTIMQVKSRRKEEVESPCGWSLYHVNNWEIMNLHYWILFFADLLFYRWNSHTSIQTILLVR